MPLIKPKPNEPKKDFISRFMSNSTAIKEYPDKEQRAAVAATTYDDLKNSNDSDNLKNSDEIFLIINSTTTGKFRRIIENGRPHIVTSMVPVVGDTVMNRILYPDSVITNDMSQFDMLPAPAGHPKVRGIGTSISHPLALNAHHIGGFTRKPRKEGKKVIVDFWLDEGIANASEKGKALITKIENGERVGVSTGGKGKTHFASGTSSDDGKEYNRVLDSAVYDHIAILFDEKPAGDHVGTTLLNEEGDSSYVFVCNVADEDIAEDAEALGASTYNELLEAFQTAVREEFAVAVSSIYVEDIMIKESAVIAHAYPKESGDSVYLKIPFTIDKNQKINLGDDIKRMKSKRVFEEVEAVTNSTIFEEGVNQMDLNLENTKEFQEKAGNVVILAKDVEAFNNYQKNKDAFEAWKNAEATRLDEKRAKVLENTEMSKEAIEGASEAILDKMLEMSANTNINNSLRQGGNGSGNSTSSKNGSNNDETITEDSLENLVNEKMKEV
jgi:hypothetical protein